MKIKLLAAALIGLIVANFADLPSHKAEASPITITLLKEMELFDHEDLLSAAVGSLTAEQTVEVIFQKDVDGERWFQIKTWLGDKWIHGQDSVIYGEFKSVQMTKTTLKNEYLYENPNPFFSASAAQDVIAPQIVTVTGINEICDNAATEADACDHSWYRIQTWKGEKWLYHPKLKENIKEQPLDWTMTLTGEEKLYDLPYVEIPNEALSPQKVKVVAQWDTGEQAYRFRPVIWYKIQTDKGYRWIYPRNLTLTNVQNIDEKINLPTGAKGYVNPEFEGYPLWIEPGAVQAYEMWSGWYHVHTSDGSKWVNPELALKERPIGTQSASEKIRIDEKTASYRFPDAMTIAHKEGFYAPQEVQSIAKFASPGGIKWYLIHGFDGDVWVK